MTTGKKFIPGRLNFYRYDINSNEYIRAHMNKKCILNVLVNISGNFESPLLSFFCFHLITFRYIVTFYLFDLYCRG